MKFKKSLTSLFNFDPTFVGAAGSVLIKELAAPRPKPGSILNILVADDNLIEQSIITSQLKKLGFESSSVGNGREALNALSTFSYDLVLMDCQMPQLNGYQTIEAIRRGEAGVWGSKTPVIGITGTQDNFKKCVVAGMSACLLKPVDLTLLEKSIRNLLQNINAPNSTSSQEINSSGLAYLPVSPEVSRIELASLGKLRALQIPGEPDVLIGFVDTYIASVPKYLSEMKTAITEGELSQLSQAAHAIKSSSASLGANWVKELAQKLEQMGGPNFIDDARDLMERIEIEFEYAKVELRSILKADLK